MKAKDWKYKKPRHNGTYESLLIVAKTISLILALKPKFWFIENPRGMLRKQPMMLNLNKNTLTYCQYGDERMKPTDIWNNSDWDSKLPCKNGNRCHVSSPRGSRTGTQGIKGAKDRSKVPKELCLEIIKHCESSH